MIVHSVNLVTIAQSMPAHHILTLALLAITAHWEAISRVLVSRDITARPQLQTMSYVRLLFTVLPWLLSLQSVHLVIIVKWDHVTIRFTKIAPVRGLQ